MISFCRQMPLFAMGLGENETPFTFGSSRPPLQFDWSITNSDVAQLQPIFYKVRGELNQ